MKIENAIKIKNITNIPLSVLEEKFTECTWIEEGSFGFFNIVYSDNQVETYFDYPTDMTEEQATEILMKFINNFISIKQL